MFKNTYAYDPWGNSLGKTEAVSNPWQFASGFYDATTGLYKFGTRYYSPTLGRWMQQDPVGGSIGKVGSGNRYVYADDAPVMMTDPSGRDCFETALIVVFSSIILVGAIIAIPEAALASLPAFIAAFTAGGATTSAILTAIGSFGLDAISGFDLGKCLRGGA